MRKYEVDVPENVEMADIQTIQTRIKKHNLLTVALLIPLFAGCALRESSETLGGIDGVSYAGQAEPLSFQEFCDLTAQEGMPDEFRNVTLNFVANQVTVEAGWRQNSG